MAASVSIVTSSSLSPLSCNKDLFFPSLIGFGSSSPTLPCSKRVSCNFKFSRPKPFISSCLNASGDLEEKEKQEKEEEEEVFQVVTAVRSRYNDIVILDTATSRLLLLDTTNNVHSLLNKGGENWTGSYWDEFASLPAIVPEGPIAIYGLGGGTAARLMLELWPSLQLEGWEIDEILIEKARDYLGLSDLEKPTQDGGRLHVHADDVFSPSENVSGSYAGIVVDLFSDGKVLAQFQEAETWLEWSNRLMPNGRLMVNCGGIDEDPDAIDGKTRFKSEEAIWVLNSTIKALSKAFPGQLSWKRMSETQGQNFLALTGPLPDLTAWSTNVPSRLSESVRQWRRCEASLE